MSPNPNSWIVTITHELGLGGKGINLCENILNWILSLTWL